MQRYLFKSERLGFRLWQPEDFEPLDALCSDAEVMKFFPAVLNLQESEILLNRLSQTFEDNGFTFYATDLLETGDFIGFIGLHRETFEANFCPCIEIGWRLNKAFWNQGLATEGAKRCLNYAAENLGLTEIYSFTSIHNGPSEKVMQKIGMMKVDEFDHPKIGKGHWLERHVLYKIEL